MFHIFGGQHEHRNDTNSIPQSLGSQPDKKHHSRILHGRRSLQNLLYKKRRWPSTEIDKYQVEINTFFLIITWNFIIREMTFDDY
jgi:hypothetical protein